MASMMNSAMSSVSVYAQSTVNKDESVYVNLNSDGTVTNETVSDWLHSDSSLSEINDTSILKNIKNVKGNEAPVVNGSNLTWKSEKEDIFYQGTTDKEVPLQVKIKYTLDGEEVNPKDIIGKSGKLKINIDFTNRDKKYASIDGKSKVIYTPMTCITAVNLPMEKFENVKVNGGEIICDGSKRIVTFACFPGLKESLNLKGNLLNIDLPQNLEITADVSNFEMDSVAVTATPQLLGADKLTSASDINGLIDGISELKTAGDKLAEGAAKLESGSKKLYDGSNTLLKGADNLSQGSKALYEGTGSLNAGISQLYNGIAADKTSDGKPSFKAGLSGLSNGLNQLYLAMDANAPAYDKQMSGLNALVTGMEKTSEGAQSAAKGASDLNKAVLSIDSALNTAAATQDGKPAPSIKSAAESAAKGAQDLSIGVSDLIASTDAGKKGLTDASGYLESYLKKHPEALSDSNMQQYIKIMKQISAENSSTENSSKVKALNEGAKKLADGTKSLSQGINVLSKNVHESLVPGSESLSKGTDDLASGMSKQLLPGIKELSQGLGSSKLLESIKKLKEGSTELLTSLDSKIIPALAGINIGASKLHEGSAALDGGINNKLIPGVREIGSGAKQLSEGSSKLSANMSKFNKEGLGKIDETVNSKIGNVQELIDTKDELIRLSENYGTFAGKSSDMNGKVKFVMKTDEIKSAGKAADKTVKKTDTKSKNTKNQIGFFEWLRSLFKKI